MRKPSDVSVENVVFNSNGRRAFTQEDTSLDDRKVQLAQSKNIPG